MNAVKIIMMRFKSYIYFYILEDVFLIIYNFFIDYNRINNQVI